MRTYQLTDEFLDADTERTLLAALARDPGRYWELHDLLPAEAFVAERPTWDALAAAIAGEREPPSPPAAWTPAPDPAAAARRLADLSQRRRIAVVLERLAPALFDLDTPATAAAAALEEELGAIQASVRETAGGRLLWGGDLLLDVLATAEERHAQRLATGAAVTGIPTGLGKLDELLNGLERGLHVLAGGPGAGKTTFALQLAVQAAERGTPAVYVTYENSPENLILKAVCARAGIPPRDVERGYPDLTKLHAAADALAPALSRLAIVAGTAQLTVPQVRAHALQGLGRHRDDRCLVVFDYLQRAAHAQGYEQLRHNVSALAGELRDLANRLRSPVLAISSQNRAGGDYGNGKGSAALDSLKESGDLEYSADSVMFLRPSEQRPAVPPARAIDLVLGKNRFGDTGSVPLVFRPDLGRIAEEAKR